MPKKPKLPSNVYSLTDYRAKRDLAQGRFARLTDELARWVPRKGDRLPPVSAETKAHSKLYEDL